MSSNIPTKQKAQVVNDFSTNVKYTDIDVPEPEDDELLVNIQYSGVCHTDICFMTKQIEPPGLKVPMVAGHEGAGVVVKVGSKVSKFKVGDKVGVKVSLWIH